MKKLILQIIFMTIMLVMVGCESSQNDVSEKSSNNKADWPTKSINMIITHGAGGDTDYNARLISRFLEKELGVSVVPINVTGSNGAIALAQYKDEKPDGYTFVLTNTASLTGNEATGLSNFGYSSFEPVSIYAKQAGENIIVSGNSPYNTLSDLINASIAKPNTIKFGISTGGGVYTASVIMEHSAGSKFAIMESGDAATRLTDLLGGHVDATIAPYSVAKEYIEAGQVKSLCTLLKDRPALIHDIPTASELGYKELILNTLYVCLAPKGTNPKITETLNKAILHIVNTNPEYKKEVNRYNFQQPWALSVPDTLKELNAQRTRFMKFSEYLK